MNHRPITVWLRLAIFPVLLVLSLSVSNPLAAQGTLTATEADAIQAIDAALSAMADDGALSGTVLIGHGNDIWLEKGYGSAVMEWEIPNTPATVFRIGSITKQFTGMAILKLQEEGRLDVDDPICDYLESCPASWSAITIYHLLTHTSGIPSYTDSPTTFLELMYSNVMAPAVIDTFIEEPLQFTPGTNWAYNNSGYHLLGDIVAQVANTSYRNYLRDTFFEPLGMENTDLETNTAIIANRAEGYAGAASRATYINMNVPYSAGAMIATVGDLFKWERALYTTDQIVQQDSLDAMWERAYPIAEHFDYGYGLFRENRDGQILMGHGGGINGFSSNMLYIPAHDVTMIVLTNREDTDMDRVSAVLYTLIEAL
jgi:CubicO group peptidase (beta-lactamase class C family)